MTFIPSGWTLPRVLRPGRAKRMRRKYEPSLTRFVRPTSAHKTYGNSNHDEAEKNSCSICRQERARQIWDVRRTLCSRDAHGGFGGTGAHLRKGASRPEIPRAAE